MPAQQTRERLVTAADRLLAERAYNAFSFADVARVLEIRKPSVHYHFPKKSDLALAVVERYTSGFAQWCEVHHEQEPELQLKAYFELFEGFVQRGQGCPTATLCAEFSTLTDDLRGALEQLMQQHVEWLAGVLERGREREQFIFGGPAADMGRLIASSVQGAVSTARALGSETFSQMTGQLEGLLRRL